MELRHIFMVLWAKRWLITKVLIGTFVVIVGGSLLIPSYYDSTTKILLRKSAADVLLFAKMSSSLANMESSVSETERADYLALLTAAPVAQRVIDRFSLDRERIRGRILNLIPFARPVLRTLGVDVSTTKKLVPGDLLKAPLTSIIFPQPNVSLTEYEETDILQIKAQGPTPDLAMKIANAYAQAFIDEELGRRKGEFARAMEALAGTVEQARVEYGKALQDYEDFRKREKTINLDSEIAALVQNINDMQRAVEDIRVSNEKVKGQVAETQNQLKQNPKYDRDSEQWKASPAIQDLKTSLNELYVQMAETKTRYTPEHPAVVAVQNQIDGIKGLIHAEIEKVFSTETISVDPNYRTLAGNLVGYYVTLVSNESLLKVYPEVIARYNQQMEGLARKSSESLKYQLAVSTKQKIFNTFLDYENEGRTVQAMMQSNILVTEPAPLHAKNDTDHKTPDMLLNTIIAIFLGIFFGFAAALVQDYMEDKIQTGEQVAAVAGVRYLGEMVPPKEGRRYRVLDKWRWKTGARALTRGESLKGLKNRLAIVCPERPLVMAVTSVKNDDRRDSLAAGLASMLAGGSEKVLLVDCDMIAPTVHVALSLKNEKGLSSVLRGEADLADVLQAGAASSMSVVTAGPASSDAVPSLESERMRKLISQCRGEFRVVILLCGPVLVSNDAVSLGVGTNGVLLSLEADRTDRLDYLQALEVLAGNRMPILGVVLNKS